MNGGRWLKESAGPQVKMLGRLEKIEWGVGKGECWGTDLGINSEECQLGCEFSEGVEESVGKWELQPRTHCGVLRCKGTAAFLPLPGENVPRFRQMEDKEFQLHQAGWSQQVGAPMAGSRAVTLTVVTYLTSISEELCEVDAMSPLRLRCPVRGGQPHFAEGEMESQRGSVSCPYHSHRAGKWRSQAWTGVSGPGECQVAWPSFGVGFLGKEWLQVWYKAGAVAGLGGLLVPGASCRRGSRIM